MDDGRLTPGDETPDGRPDFVDETPDGANDILRQWAAATASEECDAECRIHLHHRDRGGWWEEVQDAQARVCWKCDEEPWAHERPYMRSVWEVVHHWPIREVARATNLWSVPCPRGIEARGRGSRCLIGHFVYSLLCFFRWMGDGNEAYALMSLESAMDLSWVVRHSPCQAAWGWPVEEVAENYERMLADVWHGHRRVPERWLPASGPVKCAGRLPPEPQELPGPDRQDPPVPRVQCMVLVVWPDERKRMRVIADTYAERCDSFFFLTASDAPKSFRGYHVVDLRTFFPMTGDPVRGEGSLASAVGGERRPKVKDREYNTIEKTLRAFQYAGMLMEDGRGAPHPDVTCRLDSDTLFFPDNLRRILACRNFSGALPWALGSEDYVHKHQNPGHAFLRGGTGICMSRAAVGKFHDGVKRGALRGSQDEGAWHDGCVAAPGHWDDVVMGACLAQFGVPLSRRSMDCQGRQLFWPHQLGAALPGQDQVAPSRAPPRASFYHPPQGEDVDGGGRAPAQVMNHYYWRYRAFQTLGCDPPRWIGDFPVSMHPYLNASEFRRDFRAVRDGRPQWGGYTPRLWKGDRGQCQDILC